MPADFEGDEQPEDGGTLGKQNFFIRGSTYLTDLGRVNTRKFQIFKSAGSM